MRPALLAVAGLLLAAAPAAAAPTVHGLTEDGRVIRYDADRPSLLSGATPVGGLAEGARIVGFDLHRDGRLIGVEETTQGGRFLRHIDPANGASTRLAEAPSGDGLGGGLAVDVDGDQVRIATDDQQVLTVGLDGRGSGADVVYAPGDAREGVAPQLTALATAPDGTRYGIDADADVLVRLRETAGGVVAQGVGRLPADADGRSGLDVARDGTALLVTAEQDVAKLYRLDLATGGGTALGTVGDGTPLLSLAIEPPAQPQPQPQTPGATQSPGRADDDSGPAARLSRAVFAGRRLRVTLTCSEACGGRLDARFGNRFVATRRVRLSTRLTRRVSLRLGTRSRRELLRTRAIAVRVLLRDASGNRSRLLVRIRFTGR